MSRFAAIFLLAAAAAAQTAQTKFFEPRPPGTVTYEFKHVDIDRANEIVTFVRQLDPRVVVQLNGPFRTAILQPNGNTPAEVVQQAKSMLEHYDVAPAPAPKIEFVAYLVWASRNYGSPPGAPIPPAIQDAVAEMKKTFSYTDYLLLDTVSTDVNHHAEVENILPHASAGGAGAYFYTLAYGATTVAPDGKTVNVDPFRFSLRIPAAGTYQSTGIATDVAIHEGQKLVLGKVRTGLNDDVDIFLILTVKLH